MVPEICYSKNENKKADDVVIFGSSIGAGTLVLLAPFTSLTALVRDIPIFGYLYPFLWYHFPIQEYIAKLNDTCVVAAHGKLDTTIPYHHSEELKKSYLGTRSYTLISSDTAGHNDLFGAVYNDISKALDLCFKTKN